MVKGKIQTDKNIEKFMKVARENVPGKGEAWPLSGSQILSYFEIPQALGIYERVNKLLKNGASYEEIGVLFKRPNILRLYLAQTGIVGIKLASIFNVKKISVRDRVKFFNDLTKTLETMVGSDPFCSDHKNLILSEKQINKSKHEIAWLPITKQNKKLFLGVGIDLYHFVWAFYYNLFVAGGYEIHGPYNYEENGKKYKLIIRENFDMNPKDVWGFDTGLKPIKMFLLYEEDVDFKLNLYNQTISENYNDKLVRVAFRYDKRFIINQKIITELMQSINKFSLKMTKHVESLSSRDQVIKGAELSFYMYRGVYETVGDKWKPDKIMNKSFKEYGDEFIDRGIPKDRKRTPEQWVKFMDIRTDYLGKIYKIDKN